MTLIEITYLLDEINIVIQEIVDAIGTIISIIAILYYIFIKKIIYIYKGGHSEEIINVIELK